jgi:hypothetical protein
MAACSFQWVDMVSMVAPKNDIFQFLNCEPSPEVEFTGLDVVGWDHRLRTPDMQTGALP